MFITTAGIPRSGSTLLQNILAQNPKLNPTPTSALPNLLQMLINQWDEFPEHLTSQNEEQKKQAILGFIQGYQNSDKITIDKSRIWVKQIGLLEWLGLEPKILLTLRDMREVLASWELLCRRNPHRKNYIEQKYPGMAQTQEGRLQAYTNGSEPIGVAFNMIQDAVHKGHRDKLYPVYFEELTKSPKKTMLGIYEFLGLTPYDHDFTKVEQVTKENDSIYGFDDLHTIRPVVTPVKSKWREILGEVGESYYVDWRKLLN